MRKFWQRNIARAPWFDAMKEHLVTVILNTRYRPIAFNLVSVGTVNETIAHPREILRPVIACAGYAFVVMHNHPSGESSPSTTDVTLTRTVRESADILHLKFLDHVIVGAGSNYYSFEETKLDSKLAETAPPAVVPKQGTMTVFDAQCALENAVATNAALVEAFACLIEVSDKSEYPRMTESAVDGLQILASQQAQSLRDGFENYHASLKPQLAQRTK